MTVGVMDGPRIRGKVGEIEETKEWVGKWCFEISMWTMDGETQIGEPFTFGPFETKKLAHEEMNRAIRLACESVEMGVVGKISGKYFDLKAGGVMKPWNEQ
jgi:hypothetical protein